MFQRSYCNRDRRLKRHLYARIRDHCLLPSRNYGQSCVPLSESLRYSSPDGFRPEVLGTAGMTSNESVNETVLEASEKLRSELVLGK